VHEQVRQALARGRDPARLERSGDLTSGEARALDGVGDGIGGAGPGLGVEPELPVSALVASVDERPAEGEQPPQVLGGDEVPGRAEDMGPQDAPVVERLVDGCRAGRPRPLADRPAPVLMLLRLHRHEATHDVLGRRCVAPPQPEPPHAPAGHGIRSQDRASRDAHAQQVGAEHATVIRVAGTAGSSTMGSPGHG
jgi:hypothetical protein